MPAVSISVLESGSRVTAGTKVVAPTRTLKPVAAATASGTASGTGQPNCCAQKYMAIAPRTQMAPCDRLITPVMR